MIENQTYRDSDHLQCCPQLLPVTFCSPDTNIQFSLTMLDSSRAVEEAGMAETGHWLGETLPHQQVTTFALNWASLVLCGENL